MYSSLIFLLFFYSCRIGYSKYMPLLEINFVKNSCVRLAYWNKDDVCICMYVCMYVCKIILSLFLYSICPSPHQLDGFLGLSPISSANLLALLIVDCYFAHLYKKTACIDVIRENSHSIHWWLLLSLSLSLLFRRQAEYEKELNQMV